MIIWLKIFTFAPIFKQFIVIMQKIDTFLKSLWALLLMILLFII